jgi:integrase
MARHLLSARRVTALLNGGKTRRHGDGGCLYLQVNGPGRGAWVFMAKRGGKQRPIGLGSVRDVPLKDARELADACRQALRNGRDPRSVLAEAAGELTFNAAARELIESMAPSWRNARHRAQWSMTLLGEMPAKDGTIKKTRYDYCAIIHNKPVSKLTTEDALRVLKPLWQTRPETANRLRGRCERVWDLAKARGHSFGENPFRWRGHLDKLLPKRARLTRSHYKAMPFGDVPSFVGRLRNMEGVAPRALEFAILTAARSGETLGARWEEIDLQSELWTVPAARMKAGKEHRVPLSDRAAGNCTEPGHRNLYSRASNLVVLSAGWRWKPFFGGRRSMSRPTAFGPRSGTGQVIALHLPGTSSRQRWRMPSRTRPRLPIVAVTRWRSAAS